MVIIGLERGYREGGLVAMCAALCRSAEGCGELVELSFCAGILRVLKEAMWKSFVPRGTFGRRLGRGWDDKWESPNIVGVSFPEGARQRTAQAVFRRP